MTMKQKRSKAVKLQPVVISSENLSYAWGKAFLHAVNNSGSVISPLLISITGFDADDMPVEDAAIRNALDAFLGTQKKFNKVRATAYTIFPQVLWLMAKGNRKGFYEACADAFPRMKAMDRRNRKGVYFERLFSVGKGPINGGQIEFIIKNYRKSVRASMMQAVIFDPTRDQSTTAQLGFPCLQSVSFVVTKQGLVVNAMYPTQFLVERAYGNFLGISHLGAFVAKGIGIKLAQVNIFAGVERLRSGKTTSLKALKNAVSAAFAP